MSKYTLVLAVLFAIAALPGRAAPDAQETGVAELAREVADKGWIAYSARSENGTWDLFVSRPNGSERRNMTNTSDLEEAAPRFSHDGTRMLYRRLPKGESIDHNLWGFRGSLVLCDADGSNPVVFGGDWQFPWASWSPDGDQIACLTKKGIDIVDVATKKVLRSLPRKGIYQQLYWSPDGKWFCGTANHVGTSWTVVRMNVETGDLNAVRTFRNCTPDWFPDSKRVIFSSRPDGQPGDDGYGYTQLWMANSNGSQHQLVYGEDGFHFSGGVLSPDGKYVMFTRAPADGAGTKKDGAPMYVMRLADAPAIAGESTELRKHHPEAKSAPVLLLGTAWEPSWTYADLAGKR